MRRSSFATLLVLAFCLGAFASPAQATYIAAVEYAGGSFGTANITYASPFDAVPTSFFLDPSTGLFTEADSYTWTASIWDGGGNLTAFAYQITDDSGAATGAVGNAFTDLTWTVPFFALSGTYSVVTVPEPTTASLLGLGLVGIAAKRRRSN